MMKTRKVTFAAGAVVATAIVGGLLAAGAVAAARALTPEQESQAVIDDAAGQLGVKPAALTDALKQALKNRLDAAVEAGRLTKTQAAEIKKRFDANDGLPVFGGIGPGGHRPGHGGPFASLDEVAAYLGLTEAELRDQLADKTLAEIAKSQGKSVDGLVQTLVTAAEGRIDAAVADGRLTNEQATELKADLAQHIESFVNGERPDRGGGFRPGFRSGDGFPRGPPGFAGPHA